MKYEVKGLFSYGVYDGDRLLRTYESEKAATLVAEALNEEVGIAGVSQRAARLPEPSVQQLEAKANTLRHVMASDEWTPNGQDGELSMGDGSLSGASAFYADRFRRTNIPATDSDFGQGGLAGLSNGQDKETI